jgi:hypothetical protein
MALVMALLGTVWGASAPVVAGAEAPGAPMGPRDVPGPLRVPDGNVLLFRAFANGTQVYDCKGSDAAPGPPTWVFRQPRAVLVSDDGEPLGIHGLGPFWAGYDGSRVIGLAPVTAPGREPTQDVPLLLLRGASATDVDGRFAMVTYIQRLDTRGGAAPPGPCDPATQPSLAVPYVAVYYFYGPQAAL